MTHERRFAKTSNMMGGGFQGKKTRMAAQEVSVCRLVGAPKMDRYTKQRILERIVFLAMRI